MAYLPIKSMHNSKMTTIDYNVDKHYTLKLMKKNRRTICIQKRRYDENWNCLSLQSIDDIAYDTDVNDAFFKAPFICEYQYEDNKLIKKICGNKEYLYRYNTISGDDKLIEKLSASSGELHPLTYALYGKYIRQENADINLGDYYMNIYPAIDKSLSSSTISDISNNMDHDKGVISCYNNNDNLISYSDSNVNMNYTYFADGRLESMVKTLSSKDDNQEIKIVYGYKRYTDNHYLVNPIISYSNDEGVAHRTLFYDIILNGPNASIKQTSNKVVADIPIKFVLYSGDRKYKYEFKDYKGIKINIYKQFNFNINTIEEKI